MERQVLLTTPGVEQDDEGRLSYSTSTPGVYEEAMRSHEGLRDLFRGISGPG